jgi:hypothetical protein
MRVRDSWLLEDLHSFDEPSDWTVTAELSTLVRREPLEDEGGVRALLEDPEACWAGMDS